MKTVNTQVCAEFCWMCSSSMLLRDESSLSGTAMRATRGGGVSSEGLVDGDTIWVWTVNDGSDLSVLSALAAGCSVLDAPLWRSVPDPLESCKDFRLDVPLLAFCCSWLRARAEDRALRTVSMKRAPPPPLPVLLLLPPLTPLGSVRPGAASPDDGVVSSGV